MYSFEPSDDQKTLIEAVRRFAVRELRPVCGRRTRAARCRSAVPRSGWELGLLPASLPEEFGGFGERSVVTGALAAEELAWGDLAGALALMAPNLVALPVLLRGSARAEAGAAAGLRGRGLSARLGGAHGAALRLRRRRAARRAPFAGTATTCSAA